MTKPNENQLLFAKRKANEIETICQEIKNNLQEIDLHELKSMLQKIKAKAGNAIGLIEYSQQQHNVKYELKSKPYEVSYDI